MEYALLGDIHSSKADLDRVLTDILEKAPDAIKVGTGDLFECTVSKKKVCDQKFSSLEEVMIIPQAFLEQLTFLSVRGNQEERILSITETEDPLREKLAIMPEKFTMGNAEVIHGHQWKWGGTPWSLQHAEVSGSPVFYGHSHQSGLSFNGILQEFEIGVPVSVTGKNVLVNVGAVIGDCEWVHYDTLNETVTFMKVK